MKNFRTLFSATLVASMLVLLPAVASAQGGYHRQGINERQEDQRDRIRQGVRRGSLTHREAARLRARAAAIRAWENRQRRDGRGLSRSERMRLQRELSRNRYDIRRQKNDRRNRY